MITSLQERHFPKFVALTMEQVERVSQCVTRAYGKPVEQLDCFDLLTGVVLFRACQSIGFDQAQVVLSLASETDEIGRGAIECLVGKAIAPWIPEALSCRTPGPLPATNARGQQIGPKVQTAAPPKATVGADLRLVLSKAANPKTKNTGAWDRYEAWVVGETVQAARARGVMAISVQKDVARGWITLGPAV